MAARPAVHIGGGRSRHLSEVSASWRRHYQDGARSLIYGLVAALGWGTSAIAAANAARRAGTYFAVLSSQSVGVTVLVILVAFLPSSLGAIGLTTAIGLVAAGLLGLLGYLTYYRDHGDRRSFPTRRTSDMARNVASRVLVPCSM